MAPDTLASSYPRLVTDVIRVALERRGVIGFIEIHDAMTLAEARVHIWENVENAPQEFQFVLEDGAPVSARQEITQKINSFYPMVKIRESRRNWAASPSASTPPQRSMAARSYSLDSGPSATEKVYVFTASGDEFSTWIAEEYTFQQLRRDAARYWHLPANLVVLTDAEGCLWPDQAKIVSVMSIRELHERKVMLEYKAGALVRGSEPGYGRRNMQTIPLQRGSKSTSLRFGRSGMARSTPNPRERSPCSDRGAQDMLEQTKVDNPVEQLWRIFTFYCVNGDSTELESIRAHQFNKLLRDARVFSGSLTPAMVDIIYMSETKGKAQSSAKMNFNEFLNALVKVANALLHTNGSSSKRLRDAEDEDARFQKLVAEQILPLASRWPTQTWDEYTERLRKPEVVGFISKFLEPLLEMFMFYARSHTIHPMTGVKEFYMSFADYQRFINDFSFVNLQLSSVEAAQVFIAACSSPPFHAPLLDTLGEASASELDDRTSLQNDENQSNAASVSSASTATSIQRILEGVEGLVAYAFPENQVGKVCMGISAFLDSLGRTGLTAFSKTRSIKTIHCVKGVFHHLSRGLTRSRVLEILHTHGPTSMRATKFYSGTVAFNNKFLDMWRYEGSPDYLTGDLIEFPDSPKSKPSSMSMSSTRNIGEAPTVNAPVVDKALTAASQTLCVATSSSNALRRSSPDAIVMLDDRSTPGLYAGRGREAMDRLVRNALLLRSASTTELCHSVKLEKSPHRQDSNPTIDVIPLLSDPFATTPEEVKALTRQKANSKVEDDECEVRSPALVDNDDLAATVEENLATNKLSSSPMPITTHSPSAAISRDDKSFYESVLLKGGVFKKYGQWGSPHRRFVWFVKDTDTIYWRPLNKKNAIAKDGIIASSIVAVLPGNSSRTRYAFMKHLSDGKFVLSLVVACWDDGKADTVLPFTKSG